ncbi:LegC family aminotransferase [Stappia sp. GBMRC 2046]|uniref:GDP-perosamine synthase n=1 Tax=Stappia sediminis TaxID=2692190 RepID=A0A7X3LUY7_9HYPH|nr:LegC family aminotransferase [Stappia sediminis]MXN65577.1 LegC family aminotransferase [Stappia sediminis]
MANIDPGKVITALEEVLGERSGSEEHFPLHEPYFAGNEWAYVKECLDTAWVSSIGSYVDLFEERIAEIFGVNRAICTVNGTAALHIALLMAGVSEGDEVIVPALTFVASANAIAYCRAVPHFIDSEWATLGLDPDALADWLSQIAIEGDDGTINRKTGRRIAAVIPMHTFGHPVRMTRLLEVADKWQIPVVEDAAESLGSKLGGKPLGGRGLIGATSFNGNKIVTTGGGGAVLTNDEDLAKRAKHLTTTAKQPHKWHFYHDETGFNYRLPNINSALGCAQLEQVPAFLDAKRRLAETYADAFRNVDGVRFFREPYGAESNYWLNCLVLDNPIDLGPLLELTNATGIGTRPCWTLMNKLPMYRNCPTSSLPIATDIASRVVNIPSSATLGLRLQEKT